MFHRFFSKLPPKFFFNYGLPFVFMSGMAVLGFLKPSPPPAPPPVAPPPATVQAEPPSAPSPGDIVVEDGVIYGKNLRYTAFFGNYRARYYGLKMRISDGLIGFDGGASHHGFHIPLDVQEGETLDQIWERHSFRQPPPFIGLYFHHNASMNSFEEEGNENNWGSAKILNRRKVRIAGMNGDRTRFSKPDGETGETLVIDQIMLGRRWLDGEWRDEQGQPVPDTFYFFYLRTTEKRYQEDVKVFENILKTWRTFDK